MPASALAEHQQLCQELHQLALAENRFLRQHQCVPEAELLNRKRELLARLERTVEALREVPAASVRDPEARTQLETTRTRILQILQLDNENEQLLLRYSLNTRRLAATPAGGASASLLQKIYARCA